MVRFDLESAVTRRYERKEIAAAMAAWQGSVSTERDQRLPERTFPWTTACSPTTMTFPGAETMKAGIIGDDCLRFICERGFGVESSTPLI